MRGILVRIAFDCIMFFVLALGIGVMAAVIFDILVRSPRTFYDYIGVGGAAMLLVLLIDTFLRIMHDTNRHEDDQAAF